MTYVTEREREREREREGERVRESKSTFLSFKCCFN